jgi:outer membrane receptor protein involved in Fe transport
LGDIRFSTEDWFDDWEFLAHLSYLDSDVHAKVNLFPDNVLLPIGRDGEIVTSPASPFNLVLFPNGVVEELRHVQKIPSIELTSIYKGLEKHLLRFSAGFRYEEITIDNFSNYGRGVIDGKNPPAVVTDALTDKSGTGFAFLKDSSRAIGSLVLQDEWQIADDWHLTAGVRYDQYSDFGSTFNPRFALVWDINQQLTSKFLYGKAFRAPSFTELGTQNNPVLFGNKNLKPEIINTVEWAFDYRPFSSFRTGLNMYYYSINDVITTTRINQSKVFQYNNFGNQDGYGTEFEWNWKFCDQLSLTGNYAWQHSYNNQTNTRVAGVPEHHVYVAGVWQFMPKWQIQSQLNWVGERTRESGDTRPLNDYETVDFTLNGKKLWGHVNFAASLRNAFNNRGFEQARPELPVNLPLPGRSFYFQASVDF